nr:ABC transporter permease [Lachnospiraceae bacterium]
MEKKKMPAKIFKQEVIVFLVVVALLLFFCIASEDFRKYTTILTIMDYSYYIVLMAIGVAFPLITGGVDLSIGTGRVCYSLAGGYLIAFCGWPTGAAMIVSILFGIAIGALNGVLIGVMGLPPFLGTLCTCMITRGLGSICSKNTGISWPTTGQPGSWFRSIFKLAAGDTKIPLGFLWVLILAIVMHFVL